MPSEQYANCAKIVCAHALSFFPLAVKYNVHQVVIA